MAAIDTARLRGLLDEIDADAKAADTQGELDQVKAELAELRELIAKLPDEIQASLQAKVAAASDTVAEADADVDPAAVPAGDPPAPKARRTRPGRKRGQVYQDKPGEPGYVWDGDDEPDEVELEDDPE